MRNLLPVVSFLFLISCHNKSTSNYYAFETLNETLLASNKSIKRSTEAITKSLEDRFYDPTTSAWSKIWYPKAGKVHEISIKVYNFIDEMKVRIKTEAGLKKNGNKEAFEEDDKNAVRQTMKQKGQELYSDLISLKDSLFAIDKMIRDEFDTTLYILPSIYNRSADMQQQFLKNFFDDLPAIGALAVLSKFQNSVCIAENKITAFMHSQTSYPHIHYWPEPIIAQSSSTLAKGEELKIIAGIGEFMVNNKMEVIINGKKIPLNDIGVAEYNFKASSVAGTYKIPVKMTYSDQDANMRVIERVVTYKVKNE